MINETVTGDFDESISSSVFDEPRQVKALKGLVSNRNYIRACE